MCELFSLSSRLPTSAVLSLNKFAQRGGLNGATIDGWGLVFYDGSDVRLYKEPERACDSALLKFIEARRLPSCQILAHIRHATQGAVTLANSQPFVRELGGATHVFAHNGGLDRIADLVVDTPDSGRSCDRAAGARAAAARTASPGRCGLRPKRVRRSCSSPACY